MADSETRANPVQSGSYPAALKYFAHSAAVKRGVKAPTASHRASIFRSARPRSMAFSFENAFSIDGVGGSCFRRRIPA
jgi:hypothetical protein